MHKKNHFRIWLATLMTSMLPFSSCKTTQPAAPASGSIIPLPVSVTEGKGKFILAEVTGIYINPPTAELTNIGCFLRDRLKPATGFPLEVLGASTTPGKGHLYLTTAGGDPRLGDEGYELKITTEAVILSAYKPAGLFRGIQTIRQMLPTAIESAAKQQCTWSLAAGVIRDYPRFSWRGMMLDVARHFFSVQDVKRVIDLSAYYKLNRFHLHLTDDQGWRIMINSWPKLATIGGSTQVGGGKAGYYTQAEYAEIVAYADSRYITIVPEIDMPGHTNAALAVYPELNADNTAPQLYTGTEVGFSSLCTDKDITYQFIDDVIRELAALTTVPYLHIGGDEAAATKEPEYINFIARVQEIISAHHKRMIGWEEIGKVRLAPDTIAQYWKGGEKRVATAQPVIMSPAKKIYLDMKYDMNCPLGLVWAGTIDVKSAYSWDPAMLVDGIAEKQILGVEAPLWSETITSIDDIEYMMFPRLAGYAEIGWSPAKTRNWNKYKIRLGRHGAKLKALGVNFFAADDVPWLFE